MQRALVGAAAVLFAASATVTVMWCGSMAAMPGMDMPGGWTMSMAWMRVPGQSWPGAALQFLGMWTVMMIAMMLPVLVPMLGRYRDSVAGEDGARLTRLTLLAGAAYFAVWTALGAAAFVGGVMLAELAMREPWLARGFPVLTGLVVLAAGALQFTGWKTRALDCCATLPGRAVRLAADGFTAWRHGLALGVHCCRCCAGLTAVLLVAGVMDLRAMAAVTAAIAVERLLPAGRSFAWAIGAVLIAAGTILSVRATHGLLIFAGSFR